MEEKLQIPENIALRWELFRGIGKFELLAILVTAVSGALVALAVCTLLGRQDAVLTTMFIGILGAGAGNGFFAKLEANQSIYDYLRRSARYQKEQQIFYYVRKEKEVYRLEKEEG